MPLQFLVEAIVLGVASGLIGLALGATASAPPGFAFAGVIGVLFGLYPARKAVALNPIDALRCE